MAINILPSGTNIGGQIGYSLGGGIASALEDLAQQKAEQLQGMQQQKGLKSLFPNLSPEQVSGIASLSPQVQQAVIQDLLTAPREEAIAEAFGLGSPEQPTAGMQSLMQQQVARPQGAMETLGLLQGQTPQRMSQMEATRQQLPQLPQLPDEDYKTKPRLSLKAAQELTKRRDEQSKEAYKRKLEAYKYNKEEIKNIAKEAKSARETLHDLNRMEELQTEGKLDTPGYVEFLKNAGLDIPALMSEGTQEFNKIAQNFVRNAKQYYGGRVSNYEVEQFLKTVPSLSQSPRGRQRVIAGLKNLSRAKLAYNKAMREIIKENKGVPPLDLALQIDEKVEKQMDKLAAQFKRDLTKSVPKGQNKLITALGSVVGSTLPSIPTAAATGLGLYLGGPAGAAVGALGSKALGALGSLFGK